MDLSGQTVGIVTAMKTDLRTAAAELERLLAAESLTAGMLVRAHGAHLIVGRDDNEDERDAGRIDDRVRLTRLDAATWGLSVKVTVRSSHLAPPREGPTMSLHTTEGHRWRAERDERAMQRRESARCAGSRRRASAMV